MFTIFQGYDYFLYLVKHFQWVYIDQNNIVYAVFHKT